MPRIKGGVTTRRRKKKIFKRSKGYRLGKKNLYRHAVEQVEKGLTYAYRDRKAKKRDFRALWILRINTAAKSHGISYSRLMAGLKKAKVAINRKLLAELAKDEPAAFKCIVDTAKANLR